MPQDPELPGKLRSVAGQEVVCDELQGACGGIEASGSFRFHAIRKNGKTFIAETEMIPVSWNRHLIAYHFVREIK